MKLLVFGTPEHLDSIELRREVLRKPLGLDFKEADLLAESDQFHFGILHAEKVIAVLILKPVKDSGSPILRMRQVAVDPIQQGKGLGKKLVRFSESWAIENGYRRIELHARKNVVPFYLSMDYHTRGDEFLEVGIPHLMMYKEL